MYDFSVKRKNLIKNCASTIYQYTIFHELNLHYRINFVWNIRSQIQLKSRGNRFHTSISNTSDDIETRTSYPHPRPTFVSRQWDNGWWILAVFEFPVSTRLVTRFSHAPANGYEWLGYSISDHRCIHHWPARNRVDVRFLSIVRDLRAANMVTLCVRAHSSAERHRSL